MYKWLTLDTIDGVRKRVRVYGKTEAEIRRNMNQKLREYQGVMESRETFGNYKQIWFECKDKREAATREMYENAMRKTSSIDDMKLSEIRTSDLQKIINVNFEHSRSCAILRQFLIHVPSDFRFCFPVYPYPFADTVYGIEGQPLIHTKSPFLDSIKDKLLTNER